MPEVDPVVKVTRLRQQDKEPSIRLASATVRPLEAGAATASSNETAHPHKMREAGEMMKRATIAGSTS